MRQPFRTLLLLPLFVISACTPATDTPSGIPKPSFQLRPPTGVEGRQAMVVAAHPEAARIGIDILKQGGNAVDAAVAVQFALAVCFPYAGNIGGGGFMLIRMADGQAHALDFRETAPGAAQADFFLDPQGQVIPGKSTAGIFSAGVPGSVDGMVRAHERLGRLPWDSLLQPAIRLAQQGYPLTTHDADWLNRTRADFITHNPDGGHYLVHPTAWTTGDTVIQTDLAQTLTRIRDHKRDGFYKGKTAELILAEMRRAGGVFTQTDLDAYQAIWRTPLNQYYKGYRVITMPPPSSGGIVLLQALEMIAPYPIDQWGMEDPRTIHLLTEALRRAFADRATYIGDPDYWQVPHGLTDPAYLKRRMADFDPAHATPSSQISAGLPPAEKEETTHFSIIDPQGNAVSVTTTVNGPFGSKVWVNGGGFLLNNEMDDFSAKPGAPNMYGLTGNNANAIQPGKRMLSSMTPTIVLRQDRVFIVLGTPGGSTIPVSVLQCILQVTEARLSMGEAVRHKRFHHQWLPDEIAVEDSVFPTATWTALRNLGHQVCLRDPIGRVNAILVHPDGTLEGAADPRRDDTALGW